eukprot:CAMPEP_0172297620 /NCGR_PEP_ID=MMETSP1058-20130122/571_1 /TAXON_ID=83371 /ORGANISM="Detonula confervacea, Strain CCMP 353" /LENGTH=513 /DNA_ID=CAMNT_0013006789 /DNA_START=391 /DNA_END=1932 /DNA_ORIENTATION=-
MPTKETVRFIGNDGPPASNEDLLVRDTSAMERTPIAVQVQLMIMAQNTPMNEAILPPVQSDEDSDDDLGSQIWKSSQFATALKAQAATKGTTDEEDGDGFGAWNRNSSRFTASGLSASSLGIAEDEMQVAADEECRTAAKSRVAAAERATSNTCRERKGEPLALAVCSRHGAKVEAKSCNREECTNIVRKGGVCWRHGATGKTCICDGCTNYVVKGGVCWRHGARSQKISNHTQADNEEFKGKHASPTGLTEGLITTGNTGSKKDEPGCNAEKPRPYCQNNYPQSYYRYHHPYPYGAQDDTLYPKPQHGHYPHDHRFPMPYGHHPYMVSHPQPTLHQECITDVTNNDVICGRGGAVNKHPGNRRFRQFIEDFEHQYLNEKKERKPFVAMHVLEAVKNSNPPGRFLVKYPGGYLECNDDRAREKASQALRERAAKLRKQGYGQSGDVKKCACQTPVNKRVNHGGKIMLPTERACGHYHSDPKYSADFVPPQKKTTIEEVRGGSESDLSAKKNVV